MNVLRQHTQGRTTQDRQYRYTYTASGQVHTISDRQDRLIARYRYNSQGQRVAKTVYSGGAEQHSHYLWQADLLVAEMDGEGRITSQYLYLSEGTRAMPIDKHEPPLRNFQQHPELCRFFRASTASKENYYQSMCVSAL